MPRGGVKGRSGRRTRFEESKTHDYVMRCREVTLEFINSNAPLRDRAEVASRIAVKALPQSIDLDASLTTNVNMGRVLIDNKEVIPAIGEVVQ